MRVLGAAAIAALLPIAQCGEVGEVLLGRVPGRTSADEITVYKSLGHAAQDLATAQAVYQRALASAGHPDLSW